MAGKKIKLFLLGALVVVIGFILYDALSLPGVGDLQGDFEEVAVYRNENNTGPIVRLYAVTVGDTLWEEMRAYGDFMPHTKYGTTDVYFFRKDSPAPTRISPGTENFDPRFIPSLLAHYAKDASGQVFFRKTK